MNTTFQARSLHKAIRTLAAEIFLRVEGIEL